MSGQSSYHMGSKLLPKRAVNPAAVYMCRCERNLRFCCSLPVCWAGPPTHMVAVVCPLDNRRACPAVMHITARRAALGFGSAVLRSLCISSFTGSRRLFTAMAELPSDRVVFNKPKVRQQPAAPRSSHEYSGMERR